MAIVAGADGCRAGWICIRKDLQTGSIGAELYRSADALIHQQPPPTVLTIDMPIGLCGDRSRQCDLVARQRLGKPRSSSVFPAPLRPLLAAETPEEAAIACKRISGKSITKQTWGILKKVREVDRVLSRTPGLQDRVREVHPEVCFWAWSGERPMRFGKKRAAGRDSRRALVDNYFGQSAFDAIRQKYPIKKDLADDDILDAFAALWTAERIFRGEARTLPDSVLRDELGLRMEIVY